MSHPPRARRVLSIAHSYAVALNRRLAHEMARVGGDRWDVAAVAPTFVHGDMRPVPLEEFAGERCRLEPVRVHFSGRPHVMLYGRRLRGILRERWDVVHCWEEPYVLAGAQVACWAPDSSRLVFATFQNVSKRYPPPFGWAERYAMARASGWVAFGHTVGQTLSGRPPFAARPHRVIPAGVDVEHFRPDARAGAATRRRLEWDGDAPPVVGYLGRFVPEKGLGLLMTALDTLDASAVPWRALFVGAGPLEHLLRRWAERHRDRVRIVTGVRHDEVPAYLNAMDVLCAPSQTTPRWREQLGRMLIEAFACGVPVVASDSGEIPHVVRQTGLIVGERDGAGWVAALAGLLGDPARRADLSREGIERARSEYAWPIVARAHLRFFGDLLDGAGRDAA